MNEKLPYLHREFNINDIHEFMGCCDFVVVTVPLTNDTEGILGGTELAAMKPGGYLINIARGAVVREDALIRALEAGPLAGAILDVFDREPLPGDHPFWSMENVIVTPHISGPDIPGEIVEVFLENLQRFERGGSLKGVVDLNSGY